jgi:hypothetical protein
MKVSLIIFFSMALSSTAGAASQPSEAEQVQRVQSLPVERCQEDLKQLHFIYGQLRLLSQSDGEIFLRNVADNIRRRGLQLPPPPKPCSAVHLALENRCGNAADAETKCHQVAQ